MEPLRDTVVGGIAYPQNSKRLKLRHTQHLTSALNLTTTANRSDLEGMISGKYQKLVMMQSVFKWLLFRVKRENICH